jgi:dTDP-4-amino-4,6-dideoxygalactose transaminase
MAATLRARGIQTGVHYTPAMDEHPALEEVATLRAEIPAARSWAAQELSLPMHPDLSSDELEHVAEVVNEAIATTARAGGARC